MVRSYLTSVLLPSAGDVSIRNRDELRVLAEAIDRLLSGDLAGAADMLALRFQAVEMAQTDHSWALARHMVPLPQAGVSSVSRSQRQHLIKDEEKDAKMAALQAGAFKGRGSGSR